MRNFFKKLALTLIIKTDIAFDDIKAQKCHAVVIDHLQFYRFSDFGRKLDVWFKNDHMTSSRNSFGLLSCKVRLVKHSVCKN